MQDIKKVGEPLADYTLSHPRKQYLLRLNLCYLFKTTNHTKQRIGTQEACTKNSANNGSRHSASKEL
jgi:hypothetical protein